MSSQGSVRWDRVNSHPAIVDLLDMAYNSIRDNRLQHAPGADLVALEMKQQGMPWSAVTARLRSMYGISPIR